MRILLNCRSLQKDRNTTETNWFIISCVRELTARHGVEWLFLMDKGSGDLVLPEGRQVVRKALPGWLGDKLWYGWVIPGMEKRYGADKVMTSERLADGMRYRGAGVSEKKGGSRDGWCRWTMTGGELVLAYDGEEVRAPLAPDEMVKPLTPEEREMVKAKIAGGREYFFVDAGGLEAAKMMDLLKAFSLFKKRQLSNMKLVVAGAGTIDKLDSYRYREDVCVYAEGTKEQMEGAYALIHMPRRNDPGMALLNAWRARVPVIMMGDGPGRPGDRRGTESTGGRAGDAVLHVAAGDVALLAEALKTLYKDEGIRNGLIADGEFRVAGLNVRTSAEVIWGLLGKDTKTK